MRQDIALRDTDMSIVINVNNYGVVLHRNQIRPWRGPSMKQRPNKDMRQAQLIHELRGHLRPTPRTDSPPPSPTSTYGNQVISRWLKN
jgi:hypothetical protein